MELQEELILEPIGEEYPGIVSEALNGIANDKDDIDSYSVSLSVNGYVKLVIGRNLYVWNYVTKTDDEMTFQLPLPTSGIPFTVNTICFFMKTETELPGVLAVSPEGVVRYWSNLGRQFIDSTIELDREVALSLIALNGRQLGEAHFLLSTTTCTFFLISIDMNVHPTPNKIQRLSNPIIAKRIYCDAKRGLSGFTSVIFGSSFYHGSKLLKSVLFEQEEDEDDAEFMNFAERLKDIYVLALKEDELQLYSIEPVAKRWTFDLSKSIADRFSAEFNVVNDHSARVWLIDLESFQHGALILVAALYKTYSEHVQFALVFLCDFNGYHKPTHLKWFQVINLSKDEFYTAKDETKFMKMCMRIPISARDGFEASEGLILTTSSHAYSFKLPTPLSSTSVVTSQSLEFESVPLGSARDLNYCYIFLKEQGFTRIRLLPRDFDTTLSRQILSASQTESKSDSYKTEDHKLLNEAFRQFVTANMAQMHTIINQLLTYRKSSMAQLYIEMALSIIDDVPNDSRWKDASFFSINDDFFAHSFLLKVHLEDQKKKVLSMFVLFIRTIQCDFRFSTVVETSLSKNRSLRSQIAELLEKMEIAISIHKWHEDNPQSVLAEAVNIVVSNRGINDIFGKSALSPPDFYFKQISQIDSIFEVLVELEKKYLSSPQWSEKGLNILEQVNSIILTTICTIERMRVNRAFDTENDARWTEELHFLDCLINHVNIVVDTIKKYSAERTTNLQSLLQNLVPISTFILQELGDDVASNARIIQKFFDLSELQTGIFLSKKCKNYGPLLNYADSLNTEERKKLLTELQQKFKSDEFYEALLEFFVERGHFLDLLAEKGPSADKFFASRIELSWIREIENGDHAKACQDLVGLAQNCNEDVTLRKRYLLFAKLCANCEDKVDENLLDEIEGGLRLIQHQEALPLELIEKAFPSSVTMRKPSNKSVVKPLSIEEIVQVNLTSPINVKPHFRALESLASVLKDKTADSYVELIQSLKNEVWISALKANLFDWKSGNSFFVEDTVYNNVLEELIHSDIDNESKKLLLPNIDELLQQVTDLNDNKASVFKLRSLKETASRYMTEQNEAKKLQPLREKFYSRPAHRFCQLSQSHS